MDWTDDGIVLAARKHGESSAVVTLLTRNHGLHAGLVRGGSGRRARGLYQPGNEVRALWRARLAEHLGTLICELVRARTAPLLDDPLELAALASACALLKGALAERLPYAGLFDDFSQLLDRIASAPCWPCDYIAWEARLLARLGFGFDLSACAVTGTNDRLAFVSPRTGRAVSDGAAGPYRAKLLPLPDFLRRLLAGPAAEPAGAPMAVPVADLLNGFKLTGAFLADHVFAPSGKALPAARERLIERFARLDPTSCVI